MKAFARTAIILGVSIWGAAAMAGPNDFNGRWTVRLVTDSGVCDQSYNTVISVQDGQVRGGGGDAAVSGAVSSGGSVSINIRKGVASGAASGQLRGKSGGGHLASRRPVQRPLDGAERGLVTASSD